MVDCSLGSTHLYLQVFDSTSWSGGSTTTWKIENTVVGNPSTYVITLTWVDRRANANTTTYATTGTTEILTHTATKVIYKYMAP